MKKIITALAMTLLLGCATVPSTPKFANFCERLKAEAPEVNVVYDMAEEQQAMYEVGKQIAWQMRIKDNSPVKVHMLMVHRDDLETFGEISFEYKEDGLYLCETSCDYRFGEVVATRDNRCSKVTVIYE